MAATKRDRFLRKRIEQLMKNFKDKAEEQQILLIAGILGISKKTCKDHYQTIKAQQSLTDIIPNKCPHDWSHPFSTPYGLARECRMCGQSKEVKIK